MKLFSAIVGVVFLAQVGTAVQAQAAQITVSCSKIADATQRLACFDRAFPNPDASPEVAHASIPAVQPAAIESQAVVPQAGGPAPTTGPSAGNDTAGLRNGSPFASRGKVDISSRLKSVRDKDKQKMVFLLENDQIWLQEAPRSLPFDEGDEVQVKSAKLGGYMLSNSRGVSTRVRRIK